uniref:PDZ domain-containing protein n=1 Tax=Macrostomum lignano TaxID=282301 RepID=A0A1I8GSK7_9PLAT
MELNVATPVQSGYHLVGLNHCATNSLGRRLGNGRRPIPLTSLREVAVTPPSARLFRHLVGPATADGGGRILKLHPDGSRTVRLHRPIGGRFGFYVAKESRGDLVLTRFHDPAAQQRCRGLLAPGDRIIELEGDPASQLGLADIRRDWLTGGVCGFELFAVERTLPWETAL